MTEQLRYVLNNIDSENMSTEYNKKVSTMVDEISTQNQKLSGIDAKIKSKIDYVHDTIMQEFEDSATAIMGNKGGYVSIVDKDGDGYFDEFRMLDTLDYNTFQNGWIGNKNGIGHTSDGGETFNLALTMDGRITSEFMSTFRLQAEQIVAGTIDCAIIDVVNLSADSITSGMLKSKSTADFKTTFNLETGILTFEDNDDYTDDVGILVKGNFITGGNTYKYGSSITKRGVYIANETNPNYIKGLNVSYNGINYNEGISTVWNINYDDYNEKLYFYTGENAEFQTGNIDYFGSLTFAENSSFYKENQILGLYGGEKYILSQLNENGNIVIGYKYGSTSEGLPNGQVISLWGDMTFNLDYGLKLGSEYVLRKNIVTGATDEMKNTHIAIGASTKAFIPYGRNVVKMNFNGVDYYMLRATYEA